MEPPSQDRLGPARTRPPTRRRLVRQVRVAPSIRGEVQARRVDLAVRGPGLDELTAAPARLQPLGPHPAAQPAQALVGLGEVAHHEPTEGGPSLGERQTGSPGHALQRPAPGVRQGIQEGLVDRSQLVPLGLRPARLGSQVLPHPPAQLRDLGRVGHEQGGSVPDRLVAPGARRGGDRARHGTDGSPQRDRVAQGAQGAAAITRLDHDGAVGQGRDEPVALQEPRAGRGARRGHLADHRAGLGHQLEQPGMGRRIGPVDSAGQHRHRRPVRPEGAAVGRRVDAEGCTRHHAEGPPHQAHGQLARHVLAVRRGRPRPDERHRPAQRQVQRGGTPHPQAGGGEPPQVVQPRGPLGVAGDDESGPAPLGEVEVARRVGVAQPGLQGLVARVPAGSQRLQRIGVIPAAGVEQREHAAVTGLGHAAPQRPRGPVVLREPTRGHAAIPSAWRRVRAWSTSSRVGTS